MPDPAVPPTPPVPLTALLAREDLGLRQIAGPPTGRRHPLGRTPPRWRTRIRICWAASCC